MNLSDRFKVGAVCLVAFLILFFFVDWVAGVGHREHALVLEKTYRASYYSNSCSTDAKRKSSCSSTFHPERFGLVVRNEQGLMYETFTDVGTWGSATEKETEVSVPWTEGRFTGWRY